MSETGKSIHVEGLNHGNVPIPMAALRGGLLMSSGIAGLRPAEGRLPDTIEGQVELMFENVRAVVEAAGGTVADIVKLTIFVSDISAREAINPHWLAMFPDPADRPARHTLVYALRAPMLVQCELTAVVAREAG